MDTYLVLLLLVAILLTLYYYQDKIFGTNTSGDKPRHKKHKHKKNKKHESSSDESNSDELPQITEMSGMSTESKSKNKLFEESEMDIDTKQSYESDNTFGSLQSGLSKGEELDNDSDSPLSMMD
jgi:hypothetical protein